MWRINKQNILIPDPNTVSVVDRECELQEKFRSHGALVIKGKLKGKTVYDDTLVVAESGVLEADCEVKEIVLEGRLQGDASARERMELRSTARAGGSISTPVLVVDEGAILTCEIKTTGAPVDVIPITNEEPEESGLAYAPMAAAGCSLFSEAK